MADEGTEQTGNVVEIDTDGNAVASGRRRNLVPQTCTRPVHPAHFIAGSGARSPYRTISSHP